MRKLSSGAISAPVNYLDFDLPAGYDFFKLVLAHILPAQTDSLVAAFSSNGGTSWHADENEFDTYYTQNSHRAGASPGFPEITDVGINVSVGSINPAGSAGGILEMLIWPGNAQKSAVISGQSTYRNGDVLKLEMFGGGFNAAATNPVAAARMNALRIMPYGDGLFSVPNVGKTFEAGSWFLYGEATP